MHASDIVSFCIPQIITLGFGFVVNRQILFLRDKASKVKHAGLGRSKEQ
jgi:hypothetical protein